MQPVKNLPLKNSGLPKGLGDKESTCRCRRCEFDPCVRKIPWSGKGQPTPVHLPGKFNLPLDNSTLVHVLEKEMATHSTILT